MSSFLYVGGIVLEIIKENDKTYPEKLRQIYDRPAKLYVKGNIDILNNKSGIVFLSSPTCPYCRASISSLLKAAKELKMTTIYYYDISKDENETDSENEIQELKRYGIITENEEGKNAWKIPQLLNIKDKKIVSSANGAMYELENGQTKYDKLTQTQENDIYNIYKKVLTYSY